MRKRIFIVVLLALSPVVFGQEEEKPTELRVATLVQPEADRVEKLLSDPSTKTLMARASCSTEKSLLCFGYVAGRGCTEACLISRSACESCLGGPFGIVPDFGCADCFWGSESGRPGGGGPRGALICNQCKADPTNPGSFVQTCCFEYLSRQGTTRGACLTRSCGIE